jgi:signal transduction histidine kinase
MKVPHPRTGAILLAAMVVFYAAVSLFVSRGAALASFGNYMQSVMLLVVVAAMLVNVRRSEGNARWFWVLMSVGSALWFSGEMFWVYYENLLHSHLPDDSSSDIFFFLHIVPMIAATSLQPHASANEDSDQIRVGWLDFSLLLFWWVFLYGFLVWPWSHLELNRVLSGDRYNLLYSIENLVLIAGLLVLWLRTQLGWKKIYQQLFIASSVYAAFSLTVNIAIDKNTYYTGSLFDVPLLMSMAWFAYAGLKAYHEKPEAEPALIAAQTQRYWHSRLAALALFSMPALAIWTVFGRGNSAQIQHFRLLLTLAMLMAMMGLLFLKHNLMDRRLIRLLKQSQASYDSLQRLQGKLLQTEKLASVGRLVAGAAHEINNPLTAILGYSDLLAGDQGLSSEYRDLADKIRNQARRTKHLVANLLTFAKQAPTRHAPLDMNSVIRSAIQLRELDFQGKNVQTVLELDPELPRVLGDPNHLQQVVFHIMSNAVDAMEAVPGGGVMTISTGVENGRVVFRCSDTGPGIHEPEKIFDPFYTTKAVGKGTGLGLSTCYGIVRDHRGEITCQNRESGGAEFIVSLPMAEVPMHVEAST